MPEAQNYYSVDVVKRSTSACDFGQTLQEESRNESVSRTMSLNDQSQSTTLNDGIDMKWKEFTRELFHLQNKVRKEPRWIIKHFKAQVKRFQGLKLFSHTEAEYRR